MNLAIDIGNTFSKMAIIDQDRIIDLVRVDTIDGALLETIFNKYPQINAAIVSSTRDDQQQLGGCIESRVRRYIYFDHSTPLPIKNLYRTPLTLGRDRLAGAVGANGLYPNSNVLVVDFGTAITIDVVDDNGQFLGGNISPGAYARLRSLKEQTKKLPLGELRTQTVLLGKDSLEAVESGVVNGIVFEIAGYITALEGQFSDLKIIFTGGDGNFFAKRVKKTIFAIDDLILYGLNRILEYNAD